MSTPKFNVILADPPWQFSNYSKPANGAPQYPTMTLDDIMELPVKQWAADDCLLVMWCTWPMLSQGIKVMEAWEFDYVTGWPWIKTVPTTGNIRCGIGFWTQSTSEVILIGRRGKVSPPKGNKRRGLMFGDDRQFYGPINKHSEKPEGIHEWVENRFQGPFLELFARKTRPNWSCWGHDTGATLTKNGVEFKTTPA